MVLALRSIDTPPPGTLVFDPSKVEWIGPYQLIEQLGQGGMAVVYRARLRGEGSVSRDVVVKSMLPHLAKIPQLVDMFESEARLTAQLRHANIVRVEDYGIHAGVPYLTMELLDGRNLSQLRVALHRAKRRMPFRLAIRIAYDLCVALGCAHGFIDRAGRKMQIIHRDVSPSNVMLQRDGTVKLLDFGVARLSSAAGHIITTSLKGKFAYMAPEQVNQGPIDRRCDVFAAGIVLHEMLTNKRLFGTKSELETLRRVSTADAQPPSLLNVDVSPELDAIVMRALSLDPKQRFDSGDEMAEALVELGPLATREELAAFIAETAPSIDNDPWIAQRKSVELSMQALTGPRDTDANPIRLDADFEGELDEMTSDGDDATHTRRGHLRLLSHPSTLAGRDHEPSVEIHLQYEHEMTDPSVEHGGSTNPVVLLPRVPDHVPGPDEPSQLVAPPVPTEDWSDATKKANRKSDLDAPVEVDVDLDFAVAVEEPVSRLRWKRVVPLLLLVSVGVALAIGLLHSSPPVAPLPEPVVVVQPVEIPTVPSLPPVVAAPSVVAPPAPALVDLSPRPAAKARPRPVAPAQEPHRSVKEGRIVDPFAGGD